MGPPSSWIFYFGWDDSTPVTMKDVLQVLQCVGGAWDHESHPSAKCIGSCSVPLPDSVLISWLVRGCLNWEVRISGPLQVDLPIWMEDQQDEAVVLYAGTKEVTGDARAYSVWVRVDPPQDRDVLYFDFSVPVAWTVGLPWGRSGPLCRDLDLYAVA